MVYYSMKFLFAQADEKIKRSFTLAFKVRAMNLAKETSNRQVAKDHGPVPEIK